MEDAGDQRLNIGQDNQSTVDSVESVIDEVQQLCILLIYFYKKALTHYVTICKKYSYNHEVLVYDTSFKERHPCFCY